MPATVHSRYATGVGILTVRIRESLPGQGDFRTSGQPESSIAGDNTPPVHTSDDSSFTTDKITLSPGENSSQGIVPGLKNPVVIQATTMPSAAELIKAAYEAVPGLVKEFEEAELLVKSNEIFDPRFRRKLEKSRQERARQEKYNTLNRQQEFIKVTGDYGDYIGIRIGEKCWRAPVENGPDPFDLRIWMADTNCPKRRKVSFFR